MSNTYIVKQMTDVINGKEHNIIPISLFEAIKRSLDSEDTLADLLKDITPIMISEEDYNEKVKAGEITEEDNTIYYVPGRNTNTFTINDSVITTKSTFSSKKLAEVFASIGVNIGNADKVFEQTYAKKATITKVTLKSGSWVNKNYSLSFPGMTPETVIDVKISDTLSDAAYKVQYNAYKQSDIYRVKKQTNFLTFVAQNNVPTIDIDLDITVFN